MVKINTTAPDFKAMCYHNDDFSEVSLSDYKGSFVILFFYPADFSFVCPTELEDLNEKYSKIKELGGEVLSVSTDTHFVHKAWHDNSKRISQLEYPMVADPTHTISSNYEVLREQEGVADRATFIIDPDGVIKSIEISDEPIGRNATELVRKLEALKFARENPGQACPAQWEEGKETLKPGIDLVGNL